MSKLILIVLTLWIAITVIQIVQALADFVFDREFKTLTKRLVLAIVWPLALISRHGWKLISKSFNNKG